MRFIDKKNNLVEISMEYYNKEIKDYEYLEDVAKIFGKEFESDESGAYKCEDTDEIVRIACRFAEKNDCYAWTEYIKHHIDVIALRPGKAPEAINIDDVYETYKNFVGGYIERFQIAENVYVICNEEGKLLDMDPCRLLIDQRGNYIGAIVGDALIVAEAGECFASLTPTQIEKYMKEFSNYIVCIEY